MRSGQCVLVSSSVIRVWPERSKRVPDKKYNGGEYVQVSEVEHPFGDRLEPPETLLWPFDRPKDLRNTDIIELVDVVRTEMRHPHQEGHFITYPNAPIHRFEPGQNSEITVYTGSQQGPLMGDGDLFICVKENGKWVVKSITFWVS